jgi:hypothetical protein
MIFRIMALRVHSPCNITSRRGHVLFYPLSIVIRPVPAGRIKLVCCAVRCPMMRWWGHGRMCIGCSLGIMPIRIGRGLIREGLVNRGGGCDGIKEFIDGGTFVRMRVMDRPIHGL